MKLRLLLVCVGMNAVELGLGVNAGALWLVLLCVGTSHRGKSGSTLDKSSVGPKKSSVDHWPYT